MGPLMNDSRADEHSSAFSDDSGMHERNDLCARERKTTDEPIVTTFFETKPMGSVRFPVRKQPLAHTRTQALQLAHMSN